MSYWKVFFLCLVALVVTASCREAGNEPQELEQTSSRQSGETAGKCEHGIPPALCTKCNPALAAVFQAKGDWCEAHGFPESFCPTCNPDAQAPDVAAAPVQVADWCAGHQLPESKCTKCNSSLIPQFKAAGDWCAEHGYPESVCPLCNPQQPPDTGGRPVADWCIEHALPESKCTKCNTSLISQYQANGDWCAGHGFPESVCPICNPGQPPAGAETAAIEARIVRFRSPDLENSAGIRTVQAQTVQASATVQCTARIAFDNDRVGDIRAIVPGIVRRIRVELGASVKRGAPLFELESTRVGEIQGVLQAAKERVRIAQSNLTRYVELKASGGASTHQVEIAEQELANAHAEARTASVTLRMAGAAQSAPSGRYTLSAPIGGTVVRRPAVVGILATESESLATIADTSVMWALCDVPEADALRVALGQKVFVKTDGGGDVAIEGKITWIASEVDPRTRTVTARAEIPNLKGRLRANQFATAQIQTGTPRAGVTVPRAAVQRVSEHEVVFVRLARGSYEPRVVQRRGVGDLVQVEGRVKPGDAVVTTGAVLLRTEIMPGSIGAGCCEVEPPGGN
jgi:membrane fusion protein, heavy metal efflux system